MCVTEGLKKMVDGEKTERCACTQKLLDMPRAAHPVKKSSLIKVTCADCGKVFWSDREKEYCFECEEKRSNKMEGTI